MQQPGIGPVVATQLGAAHGWRTAMFLSIIPGLIVAAMMVFLIKPDERTPKATSGPKRSLLADFGELLKVGNMRASLAIAAATRAVSAVSHVAASAIAEGKTVAPLPYRPCTASSNGMIGMPSRVCSTKKRWIEFSFSAMRRAASPG